MFAGMCLRLQTAYLLCQYNHFYYLVFDKLTLNRTSLPQTVGCGVSSPREFWYAKIGDTIENIIMQKHLAWNYITFPTRERDPPINPV